MSMGIIVAAVATLLCAASVSLGAEHDATKRYRIGVLELVGEASNVANLSAFRQGLGEHGYVERQDFVLEYRSADGRPERFRDLARELVQLEVDVIVTRGTPAALSAKQATTTIPVVMASSGEPAGRGHRGQPGAAWRQHHRVPHRGAGRAGRPALAAPEGSRARGLARRHPVESG
jgi:ABC-type uncharacterized transport system substrate-binding protein